MDRKAFVMGGLLADSAALGAHWMYNQQKIKDTFSNFNDLHAPHAGSFHSAGVKGGQTHYGDQIVWLLESCIPNKAFSAKGFEKLWLAKMRIYNGYKDGASKKSFELLENGGDGGVFSTDLSPIARSIVTIGISDDAHTQYHSSLQQMHLTHRNGKLDRTQKFFCDLFCLLDKEPMSLKKATSQLLKSHRYHWINDLLGDSLSKDVSTAIHDLGSACEIPGALASTIYLFLQEPADYEKLLSANIFAGGDSAARGMLLGAFLAGIAGTDCLPQAWLDQWLAREKVERMLDTLLA